MVLTVSFVLAPETGLFVSVIGAMHGIVANLTSASGCQAHTTSPSARRHSSVDRFASIASRAQRFVTIAKRPLCPGNLAEHANGRLDQNRPLLELSP
jgi:hypothetical protein